MTQTKRFAPLLRFESQEVHYPGRPEEFRLKSRFRHSNFDGGSADRGWRKSLPGWEKGNKQGPEYFDVAWPTILEAIASETGRPLAALVPDGSVTRPQDGRNHFRSGSATGFFLELEEGFGRDRSGGGPIDPVPVFHDVIEVQDGAGRAWTALSYWFFYVYNWNHFFAHEGDWEHITLYFTPADFTAALPPRVVFFAAHNGGAVLPWAKVERVEDTHPVVYVSRLGHPSYPVPGKHHRAGGPAWRTWDRDIPALEQTDWHRYDGAWGEVGIVVHSTGPLGPWFKRGRDKVELKKEAV